MKLLFDENLAARLSSDLADLYSDSTDVLALDLGGAGDEKIWATAGAEGFVLVTKDEDFHRMSVMRGPPPKVIWIRLGNCATSDVARLLRSRVEDVRAFTNRRRRSCPWDRQATEATGNRPWLSGALAI